MEETRNSKVLADFAAYCEAHPEQRFWQALTNWAYPEVQYLFVLRTKMVDPADLTTITSFLLNYGPLRHLARKVS